MEDPKQEFETSMTELERWIRSKKKPTRHHARALLVSLGGWLEAETGPDVPDGAKLRDRIAKAVHPLGEAWEAAVHDEMILACTEHVQSVDPRYLDHPRYDFAYTISARGELEARLLAAAKLELSPSEELLDKVARADALLLPYLEKRQADGL